MNVLFASAEAAPFAKTGGLADVVGSLPKALRQQDVDARVLMPLYGLIDYDRYNLSHLFTFQFPRTTGLADVHVHTTIHDGVPFYFVQSWPQFGTEGEVYGGWDWDVPRYIFFSQLTMAVAWELRQRINWFPDIYHANDWHTGLLPFLLNYSRNNPDWANARSLVTIHNMAFQGEYAGGWLFNLAIPARHHADLVYQNLSDNLLAIGIAYADAVTTVSPRYAVEIQYPYMGYGLDGLIRTRANDLHGILNGIDVEVFDPETDPNIDTHFNAENFAEKRGTNKNALQEYAGLPVRNDVPLIGLVSRLETQKGIDLLVPAMHRILQNHDVQFVALGSGNPQHNFEVGEIGLRYPTLASTYIQYDAALAQKIYAGCDIFLMPSYFEPCGIGQMLAMRYGALPLVRETGGLADTVTNYDNNSAAAGTGFVFNWTEADALYNTLLWATETYRTNPEAWHRMQDRAMHTDHSWDKSAREYINLYRELLDKGET